MGARPRPDDGADRIATLSRTEGELIRALRSLLFWWNEPIKADYDNPYWMEDEGYSDAEKDSRALDDLASRVASGDDATERDAEGKSR